MTRLDDKLVPGVAALLTKLGKTVTISVPGTHGYDPTTGQGSKGSVVDHQVKASPPSPYEDAYIDGDLIKRGDARLIIAASGLAFAPKTGLVVSIDGAKWIVRSVNPIYSGEQVCAFDLQVRQ